MYLYISLSVSSHQYEFFCKKILFGNILLEVNYRELYRMIELYRRKFLKKKVCE